MNLERALGLKDDESLQVVVRAPYVTRILPGLLTLVLIFGPLLLLVPLLRWGVPGYAFIGLSWFLALALGMRGHFRWRRSLLAVTEKRLILVKQGGFFDRHVTEIPHARVQEVAYRVKGLLSTLFGYGELIVQPAGSDEPLVFAPVPRPAEVHDLIAGYQRGGQEDGDEFSRLLDKVTALDVRRLGLLKAEVDRTLRMLPPSDEEREDV